MQTAFARAFLWVAVGTGVLSVSQLRADIPPPATADSLFASAAEAEHRQDATAVSLYAKAARQAWVDLERDAALQGVKAACGKSAANYRHALLGLIRSAQAFGAWDAAAGRIRISETEQIVIRLVGFTWRHADFAKMVPASEFRSKEIANHYSDWGVGAALLAIRTEQPGELFSPVISTIVNTALLRPALEGPRQGEWTLELINPFSFAVTKVNGVELPLERDQSAGFAYALGLNQKNYFRGFVNPSEPDVKPKLVMLEPYHPGKIPVLFAHGLYSEPQTWLDTANELMRKPEFYRRYQLWGFRYPTGGAFIESATAYRHQAIAALDQCDPGRTDPALNDVVLVGHSMGGMISKMLITSSCNIMWSKISNVPVDQIKTTPEFREKIINGFFFEPIPNVSRIVYIASPLGGSPLANRPIALIGNSLVRYGTDQEDEFRRFVADNRSVLTPAFRFRRNRPTTIDLLKPSNPLLQALEEMPVSPRVRSHTIVGEGYFFPALRRGDSIVPIQSARLPDVESELFVKAKHTKIHRTMDTVLELERILDEHYAEVRPRLLGAGPPAAIVPAGATQKATAKAQ
jgi:pimeloyl-ACP methyl ester carboxylesterase